MQVNCPTCSALIEDEDINVKTDVAFCRECDSGHVLSELIHEEAAAIDDEPEIEIDIHNPPAGAWFEQVGSEIQVGATCRVPVLGVFLVPFTAVWAGGSMMGLYGTQITDGEFDLFRTLFGIPFLVGSVFLISMTLFVLFGKVNVTIRDREGEVFTGIGPIGWRRPFHTDDVKVVRKEQVATSNSRGRRTIHYAIILDGAKRLKFASMMSSKRRAFVMGVLRTLLTK